MQLTAIFFTLAILILVAIYLYAPFMERRARRVTEEEHELSSLMAERDRVINSLQELDFDFKLGKSRRRIIRPSAPPCFKKAPTF
jgi:ABC-type bacteriocin/lantibiotic exporter with double-glycine peptidase domain